MTYKYAVQVTSPQPEGSSWALGIHFAGNTKKQCSDMVDGIIKTGGQARLVRTPRNPAPDDKRRLAQYKWQQV